MHVVWTNRYAISLAFFSDCFSVERKQSILQSIAESNVFSISELPPCVVPFLGRPQHRLRNSIRKFNAHMHSGSLFTIVRSLGSSPPFYGIEKSKNTIVVLQVSPTLDSLLAAIQLVLFLIVFFLCWSLLVKLTAR